MMQSNQELFDYLYCRVFTIYNEYHPYNDFIENSKGFYNRNGAYVKFKGNMVTSRDNFENQPKIPCKDCTTGWLWNGVSARYDNSCRRYFYGDIINGWESGFGFNTQYFGEMEHDNWTGFGCVKNRNKIYIGEMENDDLHGHGMFLNVVNGKIEKTVCFIYENEIINFEKSEIIYEIDLSRFHTVIKKYLSYNSKSIYGLRTSEFVFETNDPPNVSLTPIQSFA